MISESEIRDSWWENDTKNILSTNITTLLDDDPDVFDGSSLFNKFHSLWKNPKTSFIDLPAQYSELCSWTVRRLPKLVPNVLYRKGLPNLQNITELLTLEKNTWALISAIYTDRFESQTKMLNPELSDLSRFNHSEREIIRLLFERDSELRETQMLIDWLERLVRDQIEEIAEKYECLFNQTVSWENTAHLVSYLPTAELKKKNLVTELYPDVCSFTGAQLDHKDQTDNERYLNYLFLCLRAGDLQRAQLIAMQRGEFWRAMSLEGWRPFHFSKLVDLPPCMKQIEPYEQHQQQTRKWNQSGDQHMGNDMTVDPSESIQIEGNTTRILYKSASWWSAENTNLSPYERAIYATLSGNLGVLTRTLPASWTDQTWAHCRALVEARVDSSLRSLLNTGPRADTLSVTGKSSDQWPLDGGLNLPDTAWTPSDWSLAEAFSLVESRLGWSALDYLRKARPTTTTTNSSSPVVSGIRNIRRSAMNDFLMDGNYLVLDSDDEMQASDQSNPSIPTLLYCLFYATQQAVMLRNYDDYLNTVANVMPRLVAAALTGSSSNCTEFSIPLKPPNLDVRVNLNIIVCHVLRFLAHLVLFLKEIEPELQDEPCVEILKAYLSFLMMDRRSDLIACYTSTLPSSDIQIQWYSWFLAEINQAQEREHCLTLAKLSGFDLRRLTRAVVHILRQRQPPVQPGLASQTLMPAPPVSGANLTTLLKGEEIGKLTETDHRRILAMDWLFYDPAQRGEALIVANSLLRVFVAMRSFKAARQVLTKLPPGTLEQAKLICENLNSPNWLVNTIREHECLILYLESHDSFADWFKQVHSNRPVQPAPSSSTNLYGPRGLAQRLAVEEAKKDYESRLERWHHEVRLDTEAAAEKLLALLTYPSPGWLVDLESNEPDLFNPISCQNSTNQLVTGLTNRNSELDLSESGPNDLHDLAGLGESPSSRLLQLNVLREMCLTESVFLAVRLYQTAGLYQRSIELVNIVMDSQYGLYKISFANDALCSEFIMETNIGKQDCTRKISEKHFPELLKKCNSGRRDEFVSLLLNSDLREFGASWIAENKTKTALEANGRIVQIVRIRNIAIPQADEDFHFVPSSTATTTTNKAAGDTGPGTGHEPRLLRLVLTDGHTSITALDVDHSDLRSDTPPGRKLILRGTIPIKMGFLILTKGSFSILGGNVTHLVNEWLMTKMAKAGEGRTTNREAPPFVPFGSIEATKLVMSENQFLVHLKSEQGRKEVYNSFTIASAGQTEEETNEFNASFNVRRNEVLAELKDSGTNTRQRSQLTIQRRFRQGGSKFAELIAQKSMAHDEALARLTSLGYPINAASGALKISKGDYQGALDYLLSKGVNSMKVEDPNEQLNFRSRGRGGRSGGGRSGGHGDFRGGGGGRGSRFGPADTGDVSYFDQVPLDRFNSAPLDRPNTVPMHPDVYFANHNNGPSFPRDEITNRGIGRPNSSRGRGGRFSHGPRRFPGGRAGRR